nr:hypothetical protein [uncultured Rhodopila sp.]
MQISLTPEMQACINARVAGGVFVSAEEALAQVERGEFLTREEHRARTAALLASFKD